MADEILETLRERLQERYCNAEFEILGPEPDILYLHMNDPYDNSLAITRQDAGFVLINLQHLRSDYFKAHPNWSESVLSQELTGLEQAVESGYDRVIQKNKDFETECENALLAFGMSGGVLW